jgi:hypothetical protein
MSQDRVLATLCTEELFLSTQHIALPVYQKAKMCRGEDADSQQDAFGSPSWVPHLPAGPQ